MTAVGPGPTVYQQTGVVGTRHGNRSTNNAPRNTYRPATATGSRSPPAPRPSPSGCCAWSATPRSSTSRGSPPATPGPQHADLLDEYVGGWIAERTRDEVVARVHRGRRRRSRPIYTARDIVEDPHVRATRMLTEVDDADLGDRCSSTT